MVEKTADTAIDERPRLLSAQEINAYLDALAESFNHLNLGFIRRANIYAIPAGWVPEGLTITCSISGRASGFLALDIDRRLSGRIARYLTPKRTQLTDKDVRIALQMVGEEVIDGMQTRLVHLGIMSQISIPQVLTSEEWRRYHSDKSPVGIVPLYSTCGICHLVFNLASA